MMPQPASKLAHLSRGGRRMALAVIGAFLVGACDLDRLSDAEVLRLSQPELRHPIAVEARRAHLDLPAGDLSPEAMSATQIDALRFIRQYRRDGRGPLVIAYAHGPGRAQRLADAVRQMAKENGVPARSIRSIHRRDGAGVVTLAYDSLVAVGPECGDWSEDVSRSPQLKPMPNFGCAAQRNLAHMVAEPADLLVPQLETPRQSDRRAATYRDYAHPKTQPGGTDGGGGVAAQTKGASP